MPILTLPRQSLPNPGDNLATLPTPLTWPDIIAWAALTRTPVAPWDVDMLIALDNAWMSDHAKRVKPKAAKKAK